MKKTPATFKRNVQLQNGLGVETEWLDGDQVRKRLPLFQFQDALGATFNQKMGWLTRTVSLQVISARL